MNAEPDRPFAPPKHDILGLDVVALGFETALEWLARAARSPVQTSVAFLNANNANLAMRDARYRRVLAGATILPDGAGVDLASKALHGEPFPDNLNGTDLVPALMTYLTTPHRVALLGARPDVLARARDAFASHAPWHEFVAVRDGYFASEETPAVLADLAAVKPDVLLVAMGSPRQELWIAENLRREHGALVMGVGAQFDFMSGAIPRAPEAVRRMRLEWLYRLWLEPERLWRRYVLGNPVFLMHLLNYRLHIGREAASG